MKKTVEVTTVETYEIEIPDEILGEGAVDKFSSYMWEITSIDEIFDHAAYNISVNKLEGHTLDYIGLVGKKGKLYPTESGKQREPNVTYVLKDEYTEIIVK